LGGLGAQQQSWQAARVTSLLDVDLLEGRLAGEPALEVALAPVLLESVAGGDRGPVLRCYRPPATVAFGRRDTFLPGFAAAAGAARAHGFTPVIRAAGGRAAAYDGGCLVLDEIMPAPDWLTGIEARFAGDAERQAAALRGLGIDARVGEVPGEYCPGAFTVNAGGARKLIGAAQRAIPGGWLLSTVVVVSGTSRLRGVLESVYDALKLDWDPATVGAVAQEAPGVSIDDVEAALLKTYAQRYRLHPAAVGPGALAAAGERVARHRARP
jgi:octanoyl-[GcvH]:protein N-octanoyltransferase